MLSLVLATSLLTGCYSEQVKIEAQKKLAIAEAKMQQATTLEAPTRATTVFAQAQAKYKEGKAALENTDYALAQQSFDAYIPLIDQAIHDADLSKQKDQFALDEAKRVAELAQKDTVEAEKKRLAQLMLDDATQKAQAELDRIKKAAQDAESQRQAALQEKQDAQKATDDLRTQIDALTIQKLALTPTENTNPTPNPTPSENVLTVKAGDTLKKLAKEFYGSEEQWPELFKKNEDKIKHPDWIYIDQVLNY